MERPSIYTKLFTDLVKFKIIKKIRLEPKIRVFSYIKLPNQ